MLKLGPRLTTMIKQNQTPKTTLSTQLIYRVLTSV